MSTRNLDAVFAPASVAIAGATDRPGSVGAAATRNLIESFKGRLYGEDGKLHRFVNVYLNDEDIRYMGGVEAGLKTGDVLDILPALAGGAR